MARSVSVSATSHATFDGLPVPEDVAPLFSPWKIGNIELSHRIVYSPLTRCRALNSIPQPSAAEYYGQRTTKGGLLITEGTIISPTGYGYPCIPGIHTEEQVEAWKPVVKAVKDKGGVFFCQLWHCGRASHPDYQPGEQPPPSPSTIPIGSTWDVYTPKGGPFKYPAPRALDASELPAIAEDFAQAARNAIEAGFDGVEIHAANGYLLDQFIKDSINTRTDEYGGSIENRIRFPLEVVRAVIDAVGAERTGIRVNPFGGFLDAVDSTPYATHMKFFESLNQFDLAYVHVVEPRVLGNEARAVVIDSVAPFREVAKHPMIVAGGHNRETAPTAVRSGLGDAVAFGRWFLANPDLPKRFVVNAELNKYNRSTFYSQGMEGYIDYPTLEQLQEKKGE